MTTTEQPEISLNGAPGWIKQSTVQILAQMGSMYLGRTPLVYMVEHSTGMLMRGSHELQVNAHQWNSAPFRWRNASRSFREWTTDRARPPQPVCKGTAEMDR